MLKSISLLCIALTFGVQAAANAKLYPTCVQNQLQALYHSPGPIDGVIGNQSRAALARLIKANPTRSELGNMPRLSRTTAQAWCRRLAQTFPAVRKFAPMSRNFHIQSDGLAGEAGLLLIERQYVEAVAFYRDLGIEVFDTPPKLYASESAIYLSEKFLEGSQSWPRPLSKPPYAIFSDICNPVADGAAGRALFDLLAVCWAPLTDRQQADTNRWQRDAGRFVRMALAHEMFHYVQHVLSRRLEQGLRFAGSSRRRMGPEWLVEGSANYFGVRHTAKQERRLRQFRLGELRSAAGPSPTPIHKMIGAQKVRSEKEYLSAQLAARLLAERAGEQSLITYWRELGAGKTWEDAFEASFGVSLREFTADFPELSTSPAASRRFTSGR